MSVTMTFGEIAARLGPFIVLSNSTRQGYNAALDADKELAKVMQTAAPNTVGAALRAAYWLAVGARITDGLEPQRRVAFVIAAGALYMQACLAAGFDATYYVGGWAGRFVGASVGGIVRSTEAADIARAYDMGIEIAANYGAHRIASEIQRLRDMPIPTDSGNVPGVAIVGGMVALAAAIAWYVWGRD